MVLPGFSWEVSREECQNSRKIVSTMKMAQTPKFTWILLVLVFLVADTKCVVECSGEDAIDDEDDEHLVHIGNIDTDSCTVDKEMEVTFAGVQVLCGENYFLAGFDKKPTVVLNRANVVSMIE